MSNPVLNERAFQSASTTWAAPEPGTGYVPGVSDGPVSSWRPDRMTVNGTITATASLFVLLLVGGTFGWMQTKPEVVDGFVQYRIPALAWIGVAVGFGAAILLYFKPRLAKFVGPVYALAQGFFVGALSKMYETFYDGIVVQAAGATIGVFAVMLVLYRTQIIKVTDRFRQIVTTATLGLMLFYGVTFVISLISGSSPSFFSSPSLLGIGFSVLVAGLAAMNLALDFDFIDKGVERGLDKDFEWYAAFGLLVTIVWLYLELLRLLSKLRER